jgi:hypothetical protein
LTKLEVVLKRLRKKFEKAWCQQTTYIADFEPDTPSTGQCYVTAICVQDIFGGLLLQGDVKGVVHFWNRLPNGQEFDLTSDQFGGDGIHIVEDRVCYQYISSS